MMRHEHPESTGQTVRRTSALPLGLRLGKGALSLHLYPWCVIPLPPLLPASADSDGHRDPDLWPALLPRIYRSMSLVSPLFCSSSPASCLSLSSFSLLIISFLFVYNNLLFYALCKELALQLPSIASRSCVQSTFFESPSFSLSQSLHCSCGRHSFSRPSDELDLLHSLTAVS
jgi:hypothetical protein